MTARAAGTSAARFHGTHENRVDAAREKIAHVIVLLGDVDIAVDDDEFDVRMAAGLRLKSGQHRDAPGMIEACLRKSDRDVSGLSGDGDRSIGQRQDRRERQALYKRRGAPSTSFWSPASLSSAQADDSAAKDIAVVSIKRFNMLAPPNFVFR